MHSNLILKLTDAHELRSLLTNDIERLNELNNNLSSFVKDAKLILINLDNDSPSIEKCRDMIAEFDSICNSYSIIKSSNYKYKSILNSNNRAQDEYGDLYIEYKKACRRLEYKIIRCELGPIDELFMLTPESKEIRMTTIAE